MDPNFERLKEEIQSLTAGNAHTMFFRIGCVIFDMKGLPVPSYVDYAIFRTCKELKRPKIFNPPRMPDIWKPNVKVEPFERPQRNLVPSSRGCLTIYDPDNVMERIVNQLRDEYVLRGEGDARNVIVDLNRRCREKKYDKPLLLFMKNTSNVLCTKRNLSIPTIIVDNCNMSSILTSSWGITADTVSDIDAFVQKNGPHIILQFLHQWRR